MIRVLIVDDSLTVRKTVGKRVRAAGLQVIGEAADGREAVTLAHKLRPDVVLMDVVMPGVDGLAATRQIMAEIPTPVVIFSAHANQQEVFKTYDALAAGALEVCAKPVAGSPQYESEWDSVFLTIGAAAQVGVARLWPRVTPDLAPSARAGPPATGAAGPRRKIVVIGASTGGPAAVKGVLSDLPPDFPLPIFVAIHCSSRLFSSIAGWFDRECSLNVRDARDGEPLPEDPGVLTVPPGRNLKICRGRIVLSDGIDNEGCAPSVDALFTSAAETYGDATIGVLLTGMGADGAQGLKRIRDRGGSTIAQDKDSCLVFGMPAAAVKLGAAEHITPLRRIPRLLVRLAGSSCGAAGAIGRCAR